MSFKLTKIEAARLVTHGFETSGCSQLAFATLLGVSTAALTRHLMSARVEKDVPELFTILKAPD